MSSTAVRTPNKNNVELFRKVSSETTSFQFLKTSIAACVSTICYLRKVIPDENFVDRKWAEEKLKILHVKYPEGRRIVKYLTGVFDALERRYLRQLKLAIYGDPSNPNTVLELYTFTVEYDLWNDPIVSLTNDQAVAITNIAHLGAKDVFTKLVYVLTRLNPLPCQQPYVHVKLTYFDERTPLDYEPPGFHRSIDNFALHESSDSLTSALNVGRINSKFHQLKFKCKSICMTSFDDVAECTTVIKGVFPFKGALSFPPVKEHEKPNDKESVQNCCEEGSYSTSTIYGSQVTDDNSQVTIENSQVAGDEIPTNNRYPNKIIDFPNKIFEELKNPLLNVRKAYNHIDDIFPTLKRKQLESTPKKRFKK